MGDVEELVTTARGLLQGIVELAVRMLTLGVDADRVQRRYLAVAIELGEEVETRAVLASAGDRDAVRRLELLVRQLRALTEEAAAELVAHSDGAEDA
jgi:hypothetical protein